MNFFNSMLTKLTDPSVSEAADAIDSISGTINRYGPTIVILAIFFIIFILLVLFILRNNAKMIEKIMKRQNDSDKLEEELLSKFVDNVLKTKQENEVEMLERLTAEMKNTLKPVQQSVGRIVDELTVDDEVHKDLVGAYIDVNMAFKDASRRALESLDCDRVAIYIFHNGNKSMHGLPFFKMSCIHEWTNRGSSTLRGKSHTDMPLHVFSDFIEQLWDKGVFRLEKIDNNVNNCIKEFISYSKTKSLYMDSIKDDNDRIAGFIVAEFESEDTFETDQEREKQVKTILDIMIMKISSILTCHYLKK